MEYLIKIYLDDFEEQARKNNIENINLVDTIKNSNFIKSIKKLEVNIEDRQKLSEYWKNTNSKLCIGERHIHNNIDKLESKKSTDVKTLEYFNNFDDEKAKIQIKKIRDLINHINNINFDDFYI